MPLRRELLAEQTLGLLGRRPDERHVGVDRAHQLLRLGHRLDRQRQLAPHPQAVRAKRPEQRRHHPAERRAAVDPVLVEQPLDGRLVRRLVDGPRGHAEPCARRRPAPAGPPCAAPTATPGGRIAAPGGARRRAPGQGTSACPVFVSSMMFPGCGSAWKKPSTSICLIVARMKVRATVSRSIDGSSCSALVALTPGHEVHRQHAARCSAPDTWLGTPTPSIGPEHVRQSPGVVRLDRVVQLLEDPVRELLDEARRRRLPGQPGAGLGDLRRARR